MSTCSPARRPPGRTTISPASGSGLTDRDFDAVDADVAAGLDATRDALRLLGAELVPLEVSATLEDGFAGPAGFMAILHTDLWRFHRTLPAPEGSASGRYQPDVAELVAAARAAHLRSEDYAQARRRAAAAAWEDTLRSSGVNAVLEPTCPITAPPRTSTELPNPAAMTLAAFTPLWDHTGSPVVAVPSGVGRRSALPTGVSLVGRHRDDLTVLAVATALQRLLPPPTVPAPATQPRRIPDDHR